MATDDKHVNLVHQQGPMCRRSNKDTCWTLAGCLQYTIYNISTKRSTIDILFQCSFLKMTGFAFSVSVLQGSISTLSVTSGVAPMESSTLAVSVCPAAAASCKGV